MRTRPRPRAQHTLQLAPLAKHCPECGHELWNAYDTFRTITTLEGLVRLVLTSGDVLTPLARAFHQPFRPETEPHFALPGH